MKQLKACLLVALAWCGFSQSGRAQTSSFFQPHEAATDGTPVSATAVSSTATLHQSGLAEGQSREEKQTTKEGAEKASFDITPDFGSFTAGIVKGNSYTLPLYAKYKLTDRVGLNFNIPVQYTEYRTPFGDLNVWGVTVNVGLPIRALIRDDKHPLAWTITPSAGATGDYADDPPSSTTYTGQGGITSMLSYENDHFTVSMGNQITAYTSLEKSGAYKFAGDVDQQIVKNGLKVSVPFGRRWVVEVYGIHTEFLQKFFMDRYFTVGGSVGYHLPSMKRGGYVKAGAYTDLGEGFRAAHFQFGTGWKF
jgi:hypothetical protein